MNKLVLTFTLFVVTFFAKATTHTFTIGSMIYNPASFSVNIGDFVTIPSNSSHTAILVTKSNWNIQNPVKKAGGWGPMNKDTTLEITGPDTIYFMCSIHGGMGMKAFIAVNNLSKTTSFLSRIKVRYSNPSPTNLELVFETAGNYHIQIYQTDGKLIRSETSQGKRHSVLLSPGLYLLRIEEKSNQSIRHEWVQITN